MDLVMDHDLTVEAEVCYAANPPWSDPDRGVEYYITNVDRNNFELQSLSVTVTDARPIRGRLDLDREGFTLVDHRSAVTDYRDQEQMAMQARELADLVRALTGAAQAHSLGIGKPRWGESDKAGDLSFNARPARHIHADFTDASADALFKRWPGMDPHKFPRFAIYNVWRAITPPPQDIPLAVCDARTVDPASECDALAVMDEPGTETFSNMTMIYQPDPAHRWSYFRDMTISEVLVFKAYDSDPARAHRVPHTAFTDPSCPPGVLTRSSVENRIMAVFG